MFLRKLQEERMDSLNEGNSILFLTSLLFIGMGCYSVLSFFRKVPAIYFDENLLKVKKETFKWRDLSSIDLNSNDHFYYWAKSEMPTIKIGFANKKYVIIYKSMYSNLNDIEVFLNKFTL
jgi:hypothetical protein